MKSVNKEASNELSVNKISSMFFQNGKFHLYYDCSSINDFLDLPNGIEIDGRLYHKVGFNGTHLAFYENNPYLRAIPLELDIMNFDINTNKIGKDGHSIYIKYGELIQNEIKYGEHNKEYNKVAVKINRRKK